MARCGRCRQPSSRVHGRYLRRLRDVTVAGVAVLLQVRVRRFRCDNRSCPAVTFVEQVDGLTTAHARLTPGHAGTAHPDRARVGRACRRTAGCRRRGGRGP
ncbi:transposase family protein [Micromonospora purpureochromogenes]|uniref:transposase family protein n=1 Tax=Micromonospora purpureochromogenes TaxID=47872 RepID=UPI0033E20734